MQEFVASKSWAKGALNAIGIDADEAELAIIDTVQTVYGERLRALMDLDLSGVEPELSPNLSGPPTEPAAESPA